MKYAVLFLTSIAVLLSGCEVTSTQSAYPGPGAPPGPAPYPEGGPGWFSRQQEAMNALADSLTRMYEVVGQYGPNAFTQLRGDMNDLGRSINDVQARLQRNERQPAIRAAFGSVQRDADTVDSRIRSIQANDSVRESWRHVLARLDDASAVINRNENPGPLPPGAGSATFGAMIRAGEDVENSVDEYLRSIEEARRPEAMDLKATLRVLRADGIGFQNSAQAGTQLTALRQQAATILSHFNTANSQYTGLVAMDRRFNSDIFPKIAAAVNRVQQSVR